MGTRLLVIAGGILVGAVLGGLVAGPAEPPVEREIVISARQYAYDPSRLHVNQGDTLRLRLYSRDVVHGFYLEGYDTDVTIVPHRAELEVKHPSSGRPTEVVEEVVLVASRRGKFRYRCSHTCGTMHPFMTGELIVHPNTPLHAGLGAMVGLFAGVVVGLRGHRGTGPGGTRPPASGEGVA